MYQSKAIILLFLLLFLSFVFSPLVQGADPCDLLSDKLSDSQGPRVEEKVHKVFPLESDGSFSVRNVNGNVTIETWSKNKVDINAIKSTRYGRERLKKVEIEFESTSNSVSVRTIYPKLRNLRVSVSYEIKVPEGVNIERASTVNGSVYASGPFRDVHANTTNGKVELDDASGKIYISTTNGKIIASDISGEFEARAVNGSINLEFNELSDNIKATTTNGSVSVRFSDIKNINAYLEVRTVNGRITCDFPVTIKNFQMSKRYLEGKIGNGDHEISIRTVNGSVKILN